MRRWWTPLRGVMLGLTVITVLAAMRVWSGFDAAQRAERTEIEGAAQRLAATIASVTAENMQARLAGFDQTLRQLAAAYTAKQRLSQEDLRAARLSQPPGLILNFVRTDARGYVREGDVDSRIYVGDQAFFQYHASNPGESLRVDPPAVSRLLNRWAIPISRVLRDAEGRFAGIVLLGLSPEQLSTEFRSLNLGATDVIALIHTDGSFMARSYRLSEALGQRVRGDSVFLRTDAPLTGAFRAQGTVDSIDRVWAYHRLPGFDVSVVAGLDLSPQTRPMLDRHERERETMILATTMAFALLGAILALLWRLDRILRELRASEERLKMALEGASEVAWDWRAETNQVTLLGNCRLFLGVQVPSIEIDLPSWRERIHTLDRPALRVAWFDHITGKSSEFEAEYRVLGSDGNYRWVLARGASELRDATGRALRITGVLIDIDPIKRAQLTISRLSARYQQLFASANEGIYVINAQGEIEMMNTAAQRLTGWREEEVRGKQAHALFHEALSGHPDHSWATCPLSQAMKTGEVRDRERLVYWRKDGSAMPVELSIGPLKQGDESDGAIVVFTDITDRLATERQLEMLATTDELTGLANRRRFVEIAERDLKRAAREGTPATLIMMDLDHFKSVNDRFGHAMGDRVLKAATAACATQLRAVDIFGRLGGEEFAVLLANIEPDRAVEVAERMRLAAFERQIRDGEHAVTVTVSLGVAHADAGESLDSLLARADSALYSAKEAGRNRVFVAPSFPGD